jgi:hypothetical protein
MKRDMDLIRELLLRLEAHPVRLGGILHITPDDEILRFVGYDERQIDYHLSLIREAGFIDEGGVKPMVGTGFRRLTWSGHDFLDSVRDPAIWKATKEGATKAGGFSVDLLVGLAKGLIKTQIEKHTGVQLDL